MKNFILEIFFIALFVFCRVNISAFSLSKDHSLQMDRSVFKRFFLSSTLSPHSLFFSKAMGKRKGFSDLVLEDFSSMSRKKNKSEEKNLQNASVLDLIDVALDDRESAKNSEDLVFSVLEQIFQRRTAVSLECLEDFILNDKDLCQFRKPDGTTILFFLAEQIPFCVKKGGVEVLSVEEFYGRFFDLIKRFVERGAKLNESRMIDGRTAFYALIQAIPCLEGIERHGGADAEKISLGLFDLIRFFIESGVNLNYSQKCDGSTPLLFFIETLEKCSVSFLEKRWEDCIDLLKFFVQKGAKINESKKFDGTTILFSLVKVINSLEKVDSCGEKSLERMRLQFFDLIRFFINAGIDCNRPCRGKAPILFFMEILATHSSSFSKKSLESLLDLIRFFLKKGSRVKTLSGIDEKTPLFFLMEWIFQLETVRERFDGNCETIYSQFFSLIKYFVDKGAGLNGSRKSDGTTPLLFLFETIEKLSASFLKETSEHFFDLVKFFLKRGANLYSIRFSDGKTPLFFLVEKLPEFFSSQPLTRPLLDGVRCFIEKASSGHFKGALESRTSFVLLMEKVKKNFFHRFSALPHYNVFYGDENNFGNVLILQKNAFLEDDLLNPTVPYQFLFFSKSVSKFSDDRFFFKVFITDHLQGERMKNSSFSICDLAVDFDEYLLGDQQDDRQGDLQFDQTLFRVDSYEENVSSFSSELSNDMASFSSELSDKEEEEFLKTFSSEGFFKNFDDYITDPEKMTNLSYLSADGEDSFVLEPMGRGVSQKVLPTEATISSSAESSSEKVLQESSCSSVRSLSLSFQKIKELSCDFSCHFERALNFLEGSEPFFKEKKTSETLFSGGQKRVQNQKIIFDDSEDEESDSSNGDSEDEESDFSNSESEDEETLSNVSDPKKFEDIDTEDSRLSCNDVLEEGKNCEEEKVLSIFKNLLSRSMDHFQWKKMKSPDHDSQDREEGALRHWKRMKQIFCVDKSSCVHKWKILPMNKDFDEALMRGDLPEHFISEIEMSIQFRSQKEIVDSLFQICSEALHSGDFKTLRLFWTDDLLKKKNDRGESLSDLAVLLEKEKFIEFFSRRSELSVRKTQQKSKRFSDSLDHARSS